MHWRIRDDRTTKPVALTKWSALSQAERHDSHVEQRRPLSQGQRRLAAARPRRVIVLEPDYTGHRMFYCAALMAHGAELGLNVALATTTQALDSEEFRLHIGRAPADADLIDVGSIEAMAGNRFPRRVLDLVSKLQAFDPEAEIVVPEGDKFMLPAALSIGRVDWRRARVLVMRAPRPGSSLRALAFDLLKLATMSALSLRGAAIRVLAPATTAKASYSFGPWKAAPDPIDVNPDEARLPAEMQVLSAEPNRHWVGVFGHIARRKNLDMIIEAAYRCGAERTGLVVGGKVVPEELARCANGLEQFERAGGRVVLLNRLLTDSELESSISAVDVVVLAHSSEGPSGIFGKAAALGTFIVSAGATSLRRETAALGMGIWTTLDTEALAGALRASFTGHASPVRMADSAEFARALLGPR